MTMNDQAEKLREMMKGYSTRAKIITLTSGKGGVGKTVTAINLGLCLSATDKRVVIVDVDLGLANVDILLGLNQPYNIYHVLTNQVSLEKVLVDIAPGLQIIPGGSGQDRLANLSEFERQHLIQLLSDLNSRADWIIFDTSAGINKNVISFVDLADLIIVVTTPEPSAITDAYAMIKTAVQNQVSGRICVLLNRVISRHEARICQQRLMQVSRKFLRTNIYDAGYVLEDPCVSQSVKMRKPFVLEFPRSQASCCVMSLASKIAKDVRPPQQKTSLLRRVANLFW